ncbi:MAG: hypothetical protein GY679_01795 [Mycoplasma sp.]|nr:hypothetical protein [Mycoplasma sp.]
MIKKKKMHIKCIKNKKELGVFMKKILLALLLGALLSCSSFEMLTEEEWNKAREKPKPTKAVEEPRKEIKEGDLIDAAVKRVIDGDTIIVNYDSDPTTDVTIRLYGIDCPELDQPFGQEAKEYVELVFKDSKEVSVEIITKKDKYGRVIAIIRSVRWTNIDPYLPSTAILNERLLNKGLSHAYVQYLQEPEKSSYILKQDAAKSWDRGLWSVADWIAPWDWRKGIRTI